MSRIWLRAYSIVHGLVYTLKCFGEISRGQPSHFNEFNGNLFSYFENRLIIDRTACRFRTGF